MLKKTNNKIGDYIFFTNYAFIDHYECEIGHTEQSTDQSKPNWFTSTNDKKGSQFMETMYILFILNKIIFFLCNSFKEYV